MAYSQVQVMLGGAVHIPILIGILKFWDNKTSKSYNEEKAAKEKAAAAAKAKAAAEAQAKAAAEAKAKAAEADAKKAKADEQTSEQSNE